ncbi:MULTISPECIES: divalent metal cation transporter [Ramlibacter]|uniref:Divalent metal cation transporter n=1 Tax=Ramlibacter aquaticus TaxID=2780094 RepID=A0ABR9SJ64_9BURK|nr:MULTISPECIES: divalent metal cation transporter [Ramlibacter]MBE7942401.1 divalent metal cation transporter [Ramlibacter aquaticus]
MDESLRHAAPAEPAAGAPVPGASRFARWLGPGIVTGASDDDPSGIGTYAQAGAQFGTGMLWVMLFSFPLMAVVQIISARIGRVTGRGLAANLAHLMPRMLLVPLMGLLFVANTINIGADLAAMGAAAALLVPVPGPWLAAGFGAVSVLLQVLVPYSRYVRFLQWLTLSLLVYGAVLFAVPVPWGQVLHDALVPGIQWHSAYWAMLVGVLGTTISPYLFFWQSAQEVEEQRASPVDRPLRSAPRQAERQLHRVEVDTLLGMAVSNGVGFCIMLTAALTLNAHGVHDIDSAASAAEALRPVAGGWAFALFTLGILGTGLLAIPVLAGSAGYAAAECFGWRRGLERPPASAMRFYAVIVAATLLGVAMTLLHFNPMKALVVAAVLNGAAAVPVLAAMMVAASRSAVMGEFTLGRGLRWTGWGATVLMALAGAVMLFS